MRGQWLGSYTGSTDGKVMINIDEVGDHFEGIAYLTPSIKELPASVAFFGTLNKDDDQAVEATTFPIDRLTGSQITREDLTKLYGEGVAHSSKAEVHLKMQGNKLHIDAVTDIGVTLSSVLNKPSGNGQTGNIGERMSWDRFKLRISDTSKFGHLYRGQQKPWSLCTSFHRRGRYRMSEFTGKDVKQLHQRLSAITSHYFDLTNPDQNGAFFNLLQHHGYPTPLLDWSYSPYVAVFFAFRDLPIRYVGDEVVRIFVFNNQGWKNRHDPIQNLDPPFPHLSVTEFIAIDNPRLVPQQSVTTVTNVHDIEAFIMEKELEDGVLYLEAIDIPANERETVMRDLRIMGITAGSMFPSVDGVCEELRERNFDN